MKTKILSLLLLIPLWAGAEDLSTTPPEEPWDATLFQTQNSPPPFYPFSVSGSYLRVAPAHFRTPGFSDSDLKYGQWEASLAYTHPCNDICGLIFGAGWVGTEVDMKNNPEFHETEFNYINFLLGAFTKSFPCWTWTATVAAFLDTQELSFIDYALYQGVLWGRYEICKYLEFDVGVIIEGGLNKTKVWPIIGFVYLPKDKWRVNLVYPINVALEYDLHKCWTAGASIRFLRNRHRVQKDEPNSQGIFEYHTVGGEADLTFRPVKWASVKGFVGSTFGGDFKVSNRNDNNSTHYKFNGSLYAGVSALASF